MRLFSCIAFALFLAAPLTAYAAEPESPDALIGQTDAVRAAIQERLSAKFTNASEARKSEQGALVEYYSIAENRLLWVDDHVYRRQGVHHSRCEGMREARLQEDWFL